MAANKISWTIPMTKFLINAYESNECLYNTKHQHYKNKTKRSEVYTTIVRRIYEDFEVQCTEEDIRKKINGLRTQYQSEKLKITKSIKSGADADSIYTPTVYWFPLMKFLDISLTADDSISNLDELSSEYCSLSESSPEPRPSSSQSSHVSLRKRRSTNSDDSLLHQATRTMHEMSEIAKKKEKQDWFDTFGSFVACELRCMSVIRNERFALMLKMQMQKFLLEAWEEIEREPINPQIPATSPALQSSIETRVTTSPPTSQHHSQLTSGTSGTHHDNTYTEEETHSCIDIRHDNTHTEDETHSYIDTRHDNTHTEDETYHDNTHTKDETYHDNIHTEEETYSYIIDEDILRQALAAGVTKWNSIQLQVHKQ